jgi:hypothetical protein
MSDFLRKLARIVGILAAGAAIACTVILLIGGAIAPSFFEHL